MLELLLVAAVVFAVNLLPAFGPPTWSVLVALTLNVDVSPVALVATGALSAAAGRLLLALGARRARGRLSSARRASLETLRDSLERHRAGAVAGLGLFALSPVPSASLFMAAGVTGVRILPLTAAFFAGRVVSYSLYVGAATAAEDQLGDVLGAALRTPWAIAVQLAALGALVLLIRVDWARVLRGSRAGVDRVAARPQVFDQLELADGADPRRGRREGAGDRGGCS